MTSVKMSSIEWPAIVKLTQNDELLYLEHQRDWLELACLYQHHFIETDQLLDSKGQRYLISACPQKSMKILLANYLDYCAKNRIYHSMNLSNGFKIMPKH